jgi:23S rRNA pseudouridine1911/1915/1917 synthase
MSGTPQLSISPNPRVPIRVLHESPAFFVVYKPAGVVTQPGEGHEHDTLMNGMFALHGNTLQNLGKARDFGLLHRLDRPTSGLVLVARTAAAYADLRAQFAERTIEKTYIALTHGAPHPPEGTERAPIWESREQGRKRARTGPHERAQEAVTRWKVLARAKGVSLVECHPETGRLHQIRAHMALRGAPLVGDRDYGLRDALDTRFGKASGKAVFLHAAELKLRDPETQQTRTFRVALPDAWLEFLETVGVVCPRRWRVAS